MSVLGGQGVSVVLQGMPAALAGLAAREGALFVAAYLVTRFARSFEARHRHAVWLVVLLVLALLPAAHLFVPPLRLPLLPSTAPVAGLDAPVPVPPAAAPDLPALGGAKSAPGRAPRGGAGGWVPLGIAGVWAAGALILGLRPILGRLSLTRALRSGGSRRGPDALVKTLAAGTRARGVGVKAHPCVAVPFAVGIPRPQIFLPSGWPSWSSQRLEAVLLHELCHLQRRDALWNAAAQLACALAWFNPLAWMARAFLAREAELCCDGAVLSRGISRTGYAFTILDILRQAEGSAPLRHTWPALGARRNLKVRITRILQPVRAAGRSTVHRGKVLAAVLCLLAPLALLSVSFRGSEPLWGTWEAASDVLPLCENRLTWNEDGTGSVAARSVPDVPVAFTCYLIERKWGEGDGATWYRLRQRSSANPFELYVLVRIHPSGTSCEESESPLGYPAGFSGPPGTEKHKVFVRIR
jgi:beta-lactamase regulating signal transducer with metallopeptidase domain